MIVKDRGEAATRTAERIDIFMLASGNELECQRSQNERLCMKHCSR